MNSCRILDEEGHHIVGSLLLDLRDKGRHGDRARFRGSLRQLGAILAYEIARDLPSRLPAPGSRLGDARHPEHRQPALPPGDRQRLPVPPRRGPYELARAVHAPGVSGPRV